MEITAGELNATHIGQRIHVRHDDGACSVGTIEGIIHFAGIVGVNVAGGRMFPQLRSDRLVAVFRRDA